MSPKTQNKASFDQDVPSFASYFCYLNLTISMVFTTCRAYSSNNFALVAFIHLVLIGYFLMEICLRALNRLPRNDRSLYKLFLQIVAWLLLTGILLGFAFEFGSFVNFPVAVLMFGSVIAASGFVFYVYFIYEDQKGSSMSRCCEKNGNFVAVPISDNV